MTIIEMLNRDGYLVYKTKGISMEPMLRENRDLVTLIKKAPNVRCKENDVVLYHRKIDGALTLHRIIEVRENDYVILGDNCFSKEYGITDDDIIAVLSSFVRDGKEISTHDSVYQNYVNKLRKTELVRIQWKKGKTIIRKWLGTFMRRGYSSRG